MPPSSVRPGNDAERGFGRSRMKAVSHDGQARTPVAMRQSMPVAKIVAPREIRLEQAPVPSPGGGKILIRIRAVGLCGSDLHSYAPGRIGELYFPVSHVLGHEVAGMPRRRPRAARSWPSPRPPGRSSGSPRWSPPTTPPSERSSPGSSGARGASGATVRPGAGSRSGGSAWRPRSRRSAGTSWTMSPGPARPRCAAPRSPRCFRPR